MFRRVFLHAVMRDIRVVLDKHLHRRIRESRRLRTVALDDRRLAARLGYNDHMREYSHTVLPAKTDLYRLIEARILCDPNNVVFAKRLVQRCKSVPLYIESI